MASNYEQSVFKLQPTSNERTKAHEHRRALDMVRKQFCCRTPFVVPQVVLSGLKNEQGSPASPMETEAVCTTQCDFPEGPGSSWVRNGRTSESFDQ